MCCVVCLILLALPSASLINMYIQCTCVCTRSLSLSPSPSLPPSFPSLLPSFVSSLPPSLSSPLRAAFRSGRGRWWITTCEGGNWSRPNRKRKSTTRSSSRRRSPTHKPNSSMMSSQTTSMKNYPPFMIGVWGFVICEGVFSCLFSKKPNFLIQPLTPSLLSPPPSPLLSPPPSPLLSPPPSPLPVEFNSMLRYFRALLPLRQSSTLK